MAPHWYLGTTFVAALHCRESRVRESGPLAPLATSRCAAAPSGGVLRALASRSAHTLKRNSTAFGSRTTSRDGRVRSNLAGTVRPPAHGTRGSTRVAAPSLYTARSCDPARPAAPRSRSRTSRTASCWHPAAEAMRSDTSDATRTANARPFALPNGSDSCRSPSSSDAAADTLATCHCGDSCGTRCSSSPRRSRRGTTEPAGQPSSIEPPINTSGSSPNTTRSDAATARSLAPASASTRGSPSSSEAASSSVRCMRMMPSIPNLGPGHRDSTT